jgi:hypothetical protein
VIPRVTIEGNPAIPSRIKPSRKIVERLARQDEARRRSNPERNHSGERDNEDSRSRQEKCAKRVGEVRTRQNRRAKIAQA